MRKTHKKILGFAGLGLVAATTVLAATIPSPIAAATTSSVTDTVKVTVVSPNPDLFLATDKGSEVIYPEYDFSVTYGSLLHIKGIIENYDADGVLKYSDVLWESDLDASTGSKEFNLNLDDYGGYGDFVITFEGEGAVKVEQVLTVAYILDSRALETNVNTGEAVTPVALPDDSATTVETYIYNPDGSLARVLKADVATGVEYVYGPDGKLLFTIDNGYKNGQLVVSLEGLPYDDNYSGRIVFRDVDGALVSGSILLKIKHQGESPVVPDTGSFFKGLNITREDYLITGLIAFMVVGVVAFGIVKRGRGDEKRSTRINGKRR